MLSSLLTVALSAAPESFVIVVGNNTSPSLGRPELKYADDDAARTVETFASALGTSRVELLTAFDDDTARLHADLVARSMAPTREHVTDAFARMADWAKSRRAAGVRTRGYFVFAGHGDVDAGEGLIELQDGPLRGSELERLLKGAGADELHVVLDSCNSWFVLNPRKAGGDFFPTPESATRSLGARLPNVGVLLSTSAESEVYEWSELQSGIFSYAFRSGLIGGADANADGEVTYEELASFIDVATRGIKNPAWRPRIFGRGPGGKTSAGFAALTDEGSVLLTTKSPDAMRLRLRDAEGVRVYDLNAPGSASLRLRIPPRLAAGGIVQRSIGSGWLTFELPSGLSTVELDSLREAAAQVIGRGTSESLAQLFEIPFDQGQVDAWKARELRDAATTVRGVSDNTVDRVRELLKSAATRDRSERTATLVVATALVVGGVGLNVGFLASNAPGKDRFEWTATFGTFLALNGLLGGAVSLLPTAWEQQAQAFEQRVADGKLNEALLRLDGFIRQEQQQASTFRAASGVVGGLLLAVAVTGTTAMFVDGQRSVPTFPVDVFMFASLASGVIGGLLLGSAFARSPAEDFADLIRGRLPRPPAPRLNLAPMPGGGAVSLSGSF